MSEKDIDKGILLLDKPAGITSHDAVQNARKILSAGRAGHTGTLDSGVTGLLVIALGDSRKAIPVLMGLDKEYEGTMRIHGDVSLPGIRKAAKKFTGNIIQTPPVRSRVVRKPRARTVHSFTITGKEGKESGFTVKCQAGTYIRKLIHDLGEKLGCGAHMTQLRRTAVGPFSVEDSVPLDKLRPSDIMPLESALEKVKLKKVLIKVSSVDKVKNGRPVLKEDIEKRDRAREGEVVGIYFSDKIIALGTVGKDIIKTKRVFNR